MSKTSMKTPGEYMRSVPVRTNRVLLDALVDVALTLVGLYLSSEIRLVLPFGQDLRDTLGQSVHVNALVYVFTALIWLAVLAQSGLYTRRWARLRDESGALVMAVLVALLILAGGLYMSFRQISRLQFIYFGGLDIILLLIARVVRTFWHARSADREAWRILIVGSGVAGKSLATLLSSRHSRQDAVQVVGFLDDVGTAPAQPIEGLRVIGALDQATEIIARESISEVILALPRADNNRMLALITELESLAVPVQVSLVPDVLDLAWFRTRVDDVNGVPLLRLRESPLNGPARTVKRLMDIVVAGAMLICTLPVMAVVALVVQLDSPGPILIRQKRIGENAQPFEMLKFRTMAFAPTSNDTSLHKRPDDPRVTRAGRLLRRYSLDELPQLVNVLRGEMSLVGPRPELPWLVDTYESWQRHRFAAPPGMTGWWQIHGRSDRPMHLNVEDDLYYIRNYSLWLDILILLRTIPVVLTGKGAY